jgi:hypothetical protein
MAIESARYHAFLSILFGTLFNWNSPAARVREKFAPVFLTFDTS